MRLDVVFSHAGGKALGLSVSLLVAFRANIVESRSLAYIIIKSTSLLCHLFSKLGDLTKIPWLNCICEVSLTGRVCLGGSVPGTVQEL